MAPKKKKTAKTAAGKNPGRPKGSTKKAANMRKTRATTSGGTANNSGRITRSTARQTQATLEFGPSDLDALSAAHRRRARERRLAREAADADAQEEEQEVPPVRSSGRGRGRRHGHAPRRGGRSGRGGRTQTQNDTEPAANEKIPNCGAPAGDQAPPPSVNQTPTALSTGRRTTQPAAAPSTAPAPTANIEYDGSPPSGEAGGFESKQPSRHSSLKRSRDGDKSDGTPPKKPRSSPKRQRTKTPDYLENDPCGGLPQRLANIANGSANPVQRDAVVGQSLDDLIVWRAIAAVTEAIAQREGGQQFTLLNLDGWQHVMAGNEVWPNVAARLGNETFIPWTTQIAHGENAFGHTSLFILGRDDSQKFTLRHFDTANRFRDHRASAVTHGAAIRRALHNLGWPQQDPNSAIPAVTDPGHQGRQPPGIGWVCGIYTVLFSWAHALGLDFSAFTRVDPNRLSGPNGFLAQAVQLINLALSGLLDDDTLRAFLRCYELVPMDAQISANRRFRRTVAFRSQQELAEHIAELRFMEDMARIERTRGVPGNGRMRLMSFLEILKEGHPEDCFRWSADEYIDSLADGLERCGITSLPFGPAARSSDKDKNRGFGGSEGSGGQGQQPGGRVVTPKSDDNKRKRGPKGKGSQQGQQDPSQQDPSQEDPNPCQEFEDALNHLENTAEPLEVQDRIQPGVMLNDGVVFRAIAAVTEAISDAGSVQFGLLDSTDLNQVKRKQSPFQHIARPGSTLLLPYIPDTRHSSLFHFERIDHASFRASHHDSSHHVHTERAARNFRQLQEDLRALRWQRGEESHRVEPLTSMPAIQQRGSWECGLHVILNAWTIALGFAPSPTTDMTNDRYRTRFLPDTIRIVNFALEGRVGSSTIEAFLRCYGFITGNNTIPPECVFEQTVPFLDQLRLSLRVARVRLQADLDELQRRDSDATASFDLDTILDMLHEGEDNQHVPDLSQVTVDELLLRLRDSDQTIRRAANLFTTPPRGERQPSEPRSSEQRRRLALEAGVSEEDIRTQQQLLALARQRIGFRSPESPQREGAGISYKPRRATPPRTSARESTSPTSSVRMQQAIEVSRQPRSPEDTGSPQNKSPERRRRT